MNKIWCIFFMVCSCSSLLFCQEVRDMSLDELRFAATQWNQKDTNRYVDVLNELVFLKRNDLDNVDSVKMWAKRAEELAIANNYLVGEGDALNRLGLLEKKTGNTESAIEYYEKSLIIRRDELRNYSQASSVCNNLGNLFKLQNGGLPKSIFYFQEGLKLLNTAADNKSKFRSKAMIMNNLGWVLALNGQYEDALISFDSSLIIRRELADSVGIANVLLNKGLLFKLNFNYDRSFILWNEALEIFTRKDDYRGVAKCILALGDYYNIKGEYEKAVENYNRALGLSDFLDFDDVATIYQNKGIAHLNLREIRDAEKEFQAGMSFFKKANDEAGINLLFFNYGTFHYENGDYEKAISFFRKILDKTGLSDDLPKRMNLLYFLKDSYIALEDADSALKYANIYTNLKDTIDNSYRDAMNTQYNLAIAENEIQRLNIERAAENQKKMKTFGLIGFGVSWLLLGLAVMGYYLSRQRRRLAEKNIQLAKQEVIELIQEKDLETNYAWMDGVETTRKQIGQELHDTLARRAGEELCHNTAIITGGTGGGGLLTTAMFVKQGFDTWVVGRRDPSDPVVQRLLNLGANYHQIQLSAEQQGSSRTWMEYLPEMAGEMGIELDGAVGGARFLFDLSGNPTWVAKIGTLIGATGMIVDYAIPEGEAKMGDQIDGAEIIRQRTVNNHGRVGSVNLDSANDFSDAVSLLEWLCAEHLNVLQSAVFPIEGLDIEALSAALQDNSIIKPMLFPRGKAAAGWVD